MNEHQLPNQPAADLKSEKRFKIEVTASEAAIIKHYRTLKEFDEVMVLKRGGRLLMLKPTYNIMYAPQLGEQAALELKGEEVIE
jgi:hypothetical protein